VDTIKKEIKMLNGKTVLVTGGTGSFGRKFAEIALLKYKPKKLIIFSRDEMKQYEMKQIFSEDKYKNIRYFIGDVRDVERLHRAFNGVDIVIHAAALKIVPSSEYNPFEVVRTNVFGAENIINVAIDNNVKRVIALSSDKAVNPVNLYGATKLCAEKMFIAANNYSPHGTKFSVVRYGNVIGSRGSVVPFFKECRLKGEVPITDEDMTRFCITLQQGVEFVLSCLKTMKGGEIFVPKIPSIKITDLAKAICPDCKHKVIGMRPGEKLYESLLSCDDGIHSYEFKDRFIIYPKVVDHNCGKKEGEYLGINFQGYRSDNNKRWLDAGQLKKIIKSEGF
jgi:UDP-N-acetylglucosamine 4,6-dehydratase